MRPSIVFNKHRDAIREIALRHRVENIRVFGSVLHGVDTDESDLDLLVDPTCWRRLKIDHFEGVVPIEN